VKVNRLSDSLAEVVQATIADIEKKQSRTLREQLDAMNAESDESEGEKDEEKEEEDEEQGAVLCCKCCLFLFCFVNKDLCVRSRIIQLDGEKTRSL
jgi:hypothetical protein